MHNGIGEMREGSWCVAGTDALDDCVEFEYPSHTKFHRLSPIYYPYIAQQVATIAPPRILPETAPLIFLMNILIGETCEFDSYPIMYT